MLLVSLSLRLLQGFMIIVYDVGTGVPSPAVGKFYCSGSWNYSDLCVPCSDCGQVGHASESLVTQISYSHFSNF